MTLNDVIKTLDLNGWKRQEFSELNNGGSKRVGYSKGGIYLNLEGFKIENSHYRNRFFLWKGKYETNETLIEFLKKSENDKNPEIYKCNNLILIEDIEDIFGNEINNLLNKYITFTGQLNTIIKNKKRYVDKKIMLDFLDSIFCTNLLDEEHILKNSTTSADIIKNQIPGVYFLIYNKKIIYIGQSHNMIKRVCEHTNKKYDSIYLLPTSFEECAVYEFFYIIKLNPEINNGGKISKLRMFLMSTYKKDYDTLRNRLLNTKTYDFT